MKANWFETPELEEQYRSRLSWFPYPKKDDTLFSDLQASNRRRPGTVILHRDSRKVHLTNSEESYITSKGDQ